MTISEGSTVSEPTKKTVSTRCYEESVDPSPEKVIMIDEKTTKTKSEDRPNVFIRLLRKVYRPLGFTKAYNFVLFIILAGAMLGFTLARLSYLDVGSGKKSSYSGGTLPGQWYWYKTGYYRVGITMHLAAILPAGFLMVWQFVPFIRRNYVLFHRINGTVIILLVFVGNVGALMIARRAFGGGLDTQSAVGLSVILVTVSIGMGYYNIKRLQIEQHRAWMLRAMVYLGIIITTRLIMALSAVIISKINTYYTTYSCDELAYFYPNREDLLTRYPACNVTDHATVKANMGAGGAETVAAAFHLSFGAALWISLLLHVIGVEIYLNLTPKETERLRKVSYKRQLEAGHKHPGSSGITVDRWGDSEPWVYRE